MKTKNPIMIKFIDIKKNDPYDLFHYSYTKALSLKQSHIEAVAISSFNSLSNEVDSRFVNLKYIKNDEWIFFSNYNGAKAKSFKSNDQISALFFWDSINTQIRIKAKIFKTDEQFSDMHFKKRSIEKNALAISSMQSEKISSYKKVYNKYLKTLDIVDEKTSRPPYWGGYSFTPYYFEFWEGSDSRVNKRNVFELVLDSWKNYYLEP